MENLYLEAYKIRKVESALLDLFGEGLVGGTIHTCVGQEFTGVTLAPNLIKGDVVVSNHRCHGHYMAIYKDYKGLISEILGKPSGVNRGFGGSQHIHREGFFSSGIQGGMLPNAAGIALSNKLRKNNNIAVSYIGDGTLGQGIIYETFNFVSKHDVPLVVVVENNKYSQSTSQHETLSGTIKERAQAFHIDYFHGDTNSPKELAETMTKAISFSREKSRPVIIEIETYRLNAHSKGDDDRNKEEVNAARKADALNIFLENKSSEIESKIEEFDNYVDNAIKEALDEENSIIINEEDNYSIKDTERSITVSKQITTLAKEQNKAFLEIFKDFPEALFIGEDIKDPYGGAFKTTKGLTDKYPERVFNMPISEPMIAGLSLGSAISGRLTFCEIMFGDFLALAFDQILNHASKMQNMFGKEIKTPLIIRTPMGGGRGYGATHSQCIEKHFMGLPGLQTFIFHHRVDCHRFYTDLAKNIEVPSLVFEHKLLYSQDPNKKIPSEYSLSESEELFPYTRLKPEEEADITVVSIGGTGTILESILEKITDEEVYLDIYFPLDMNSHNFINAISKSVKKTKKILFIEEGTPNYSVSDHLLSAVSQSISNQAKFSAKMIHSVAIPIPASTYLEKQVLPQAEKIEKTIWELFDE